MLNYFTEVFMKTIDYHNNRLATVAFVVIALAGIKASSSIIIPFIFSLFLAVITMPIVNVFKRLKIPNGFSVVLSLLFVLSFMIVVGQFFYTSLKTLISNSKEYYEMFIVTLNTLPHIDLFSNYGLSFDVLKEQISAQKLMNFGVDVLGVLSSMTASTLLVFIITAFMLLEVDAIKSKVQKFSLKNTELPDKILSFTSSVRKYLLIKTLISLATGLIIGFGLYIMGVPHFILFAVIAFFLNFIPTIGSAVAAIPAIAIAFIVLGPTYALITAAFYGVVNIMIGSIIEPRFMGENLGLSTLAVFLSLVFFGYILGTSGMLMAIPLTMIIKIAADKSDRWNWLSEVLR
jgi:predicted PurR-regulated permease PerM